MLFNQLVVKQFIANCFIAPFYVFTYLFASLGNDSKHVSSGQSSNMVAIHSEDSTIKPDPAESETSDDGFITVIYGKTRYPNVQNPVVRTFKTTNPYEPLCTHSAEDVYLPNMVSPFEQGPDPVQKQVNTKWTRDHCRNNNNKKKIKKNKKNKQYKKYNKLSNSHKEDFPYDLIDKMINENHNHIKEVVNRYTPIDNCDLVKSINKMNIEVRSYYILKLREIRCHQ